MIVNAWPTYSDSDGHYIRALPIDSIQQYITGDAMIRFAGDFAPVVVSASFMRIWNPEKGGYLIQSAGEYLYLSKSAFESKYTSAGGSHVSPDDITGATSVGISLLTAANTGAAQTAIGASELGKSLLTVDTDGEARTLIKAAIDRLANSTQPGMMTPEQYKKVAGLAISASAANSDVSIAEVSFDATGKAQLVLKIENGKIADRTISSAGLSGTKIVSASDIASAGGTVSIPKGTTVDAALKILADAVDPSA